VDKKSATLGLSGKREKQLSLAADHASICKFESPDGDDFEQVIGNLEDMAEGALKNLAVRKRMEDLSIPLASLKLEQNPVSM